MAKKAVKKAAKKVAPAKKKVAKKAAKKVMKKTVKKTAKKTVAKKAAKKAVKKSAVKKSVKKVTKKAAKKTVKKAVKKAAKKAAVKKTTAKKSTPKKAIKKVAAKKTATAKKTVVAAPPKPKIKLAREQLKARQLYSSELEPQVDKKPLTAKQMRELKKFLQEERSRLIREVNGLQRFTHLNDENGSTEQDTYSNHMAESASDYAMMEMTLLQNSNETLLLQMIEDCLANKLPNKVYSICERCSAYIGYERLEAKPWARLCFVCKNAMERGRI